MSDSTERHLSRILGEIFGEIVRAQEDDGRQRREVSSEEKESSPVDCE